MYNYGKNMSFGYCMLNTELTLQSMPVSGTSQMPQSDSTTKTSRNNHISARDLTKEGKNSKNDVSSQYVVYFKALSGIFTKRLEEFLSP